MEQQQTTGREDARRFHVHTCLGAGGFGEVYKATMTSAGGVQHEVAIKVLHDGLDPRSQAVQRLRDEGKLLGVLRHPAILRVHDLVLLNGRVSLVTEYIEGGDLDMCFSDGEMPSRALIDVIGQVAAALDAAWNTEAPNGEGQLNLVHRDVKPANIRLGKHAEVKLLDFGIAKAAGVKREAQTQAKALIGSYLYMSPERLDKKEGLVPAGDVYALGAVLYEGLSQERLFGDVDLKEQYKLSWDPGQHDLFVKKKVDKLEGVDSRVIDVLLEMLSHGEEDRPEAGVLAKHCESLADDLSGKSLRQWCRARDWPAPEDIPGALGGRTITESAFTTGTITSGTLEKMTKPGEGTMVGFLDTSATMQPISQHPDEMATGSVEESSGMGRTAALALMALFGIGGLGSLAVLVLFVLPQLSGTTEPLDGAAAVNEPVAEAAAAVEAKGSETEEAPVEDPPQEAAEAPEDGEAVAEEGTETEAATVVETVPEPTTVPEPAPSPAPQPTHTAPPPKPAPVTAPAPSATTAKVVLLKAIPVQLRGGGGTHTGGGDVPVGTYEIWADFGEGFTRASGESLILTAGSTVSIRCSALKHSCSKE